MQRIGLTEMVGIKYKQYSLGAILSAACCMILIYWISACGEVSNNGSVFRGTLLVPELSASGVSPSEIQLQWQDISNNPNGTQLLVQQKTGSENFSNLVVLDSDQTSYTSSDLQSQTTYVYRVQVSDTNGIYSSQTSAVVTAQTLPGHVTPTPNDG